MKWCCVVCPVSLPHHACYPLVSCLWARGINRIEPSPKFDGDVWTRNWKDYNQLYLKVLVSGKRDPEEVITLCIYSDSSQSLASILSCLRLSKSPTSRTTVGLEDVIGRMPLSGSFIIPSASSNAEGRKWNQAWIMHSIKLTSASNEPASRSQ